MMKTIGILLIISLFSLSGLARKATVIEPSQMEVQYLLTEQRDTLHLNQPKTDLLVLRIGKTCSVCLNRQTFYGDSMLADPNGSKVLMTQILSTLNPNSHATAPVSTTQLRSYIYKNYPQGIMTSLDRIGIEGYRYEEPYAPQVWTMQDSVRQIMGYTCQKAECDFRGRHYTAWFAPDIPVSDGPWKLNGLPGLILEAYDSRHYFHFIISGLKQHGVQPVCFYDGYKKYNRITRVAFMKAKLRESTVVAAQLRQMDLDIASRPVLKYKTNIEKW